MIVKTLRNIHARIYFRVCEKNELFSYYLKCFKNIFRKTVVWMNQSISR